MTTLSPAQATLATTAAALFALAAPGVQAQPVQWSANGHYYEFVADAVTWQEALSLAAQRSHLGMTGYLATAVGEAENSFISVTVGNDRLGWLSASDDGAEGQWTWRAGPEAGQALTWFNWAPSEPNNCCNGENYLHTNWFAGGVWNDHGGPGNPGQVNGFFVEYSPAVPEPGAAVMLALGLAGLGLQLRRRRQR
jgi:hypothetical protein